MTRPPWEVADFIQRGGSRFLDRYRKCLTYPKLKVLNAITHCRTAALGGHRDQCDRCGHQTISYNSCRNRHCPKCQTNARDKWLRSRQQELLPVTYYHVIFSVSHRFVPLLWQNKRVLFALLFEATAATLLEVAANPKRLGAFIGFLSVLHTWGQTLQPHPHIHCVVPGGGLSPDHQRWIYSQPHFFLPVRVLSRVFRGKFVAGLQQLFRLNQLQFFGACQQLSDAKGIQRFLRTLFAKNGSSTPSSRLADRSMSCITLPAGFPRIRILRVSRQSSSQPASAVMPQPVRGLSCIPCHKHCSYFRPFLSSLPSAHESSSDSPPLNFSANTTVWLLLLIAHNDTALSALRVLSGTPCLTCVHTPDTTLASALECLFVCWRYPAAVITPAAVNDQTPRASCRPPALSGS